MGNSDSKIHLLTVGQSLPLGFHLFARQSAKIRYLTGAFPLQGQRLLTTE